MGNANVSAPSAVSAVIFPRWISGNRADIHETVKRHRGQEVIDSGEKVALLAPNTLFLQACEK